MISLDWIAQQEYLGRGFILGRTQEGRDFAAYFITGRSPSSRARKFVKLKDGTVKTLPTNLKAKIDPEQELSEEAKQEIREKGGNPSLLIYNAIRGYQERLVVSNGAQTDFLKYATPFEIFSKFFDNRGVVVDGIDLTSFEPDAPNYTPRISGVIWPNKSGIAIAKRNHGRLERQIFEFELIPGFGKFISTYTGQNVPKGTPLPSFSGEPLDFLVMGDKIEKIAQELYDSLGPKQGTQYLSPGEDFRVGVVVATCTPKGEKINPAIINRS